MNLFDLKGKAALVTGGNGGIGLGMALGLAHAGAKVAIEKAVIESAPEATGIEYELPQINLTVGNAVPVEFSRRSAPGGSAANGGGVSVSIGRKPR